MAIPRQIEPEWLDSLPAEDPGAVWSRRDLRHLNFLMLNAWMVERALIAHSPQDRPPRTIIEIGAGDGTWMFSLARRLARRWAGVHVTLLDRQDLLTAATRQAFASLGWTVEAVTGDVFDHLDRQGAPFDIVIANLFLHHFRDGELSRLFTRIAELTRLLVACEPRRASLPLFASHLLWAIGCNGVTRHDAVASVRAGFAGNELSRLWPHQPQWRLKEYPGWPFSHCFVACHADRVP